ncbi:unnamed protein product [Cochlearia groenlandica]
MVGKPLYVDETSLKTICVLGKGYSGSVSLEEHPSHGFFCAKRTASMDLKEVLEKELRIMLHFRNHPRIVQALSDHVYTTTTTKDPQGCCYMYMEYASQGTLSNIISSYNNKPLPEHMIQSAARMILQGLDALHSQGYVHCNLTPWNVLVFPSTTPGEPWDLKLTDLGSSKEPSKKVSECFCRGTTEYMSAESFVYWPEGTILPCYDIYSLGCVVYKMLGGKHYQEIFEEYYEWFLFEEISPVAKDFLRQCQHMKYQDRATAAELLNHPFITQKITVPLPLQTLQEDNKIPTGEDNAEDMKI